MFCSIGSIIGPRASLGKKEMRTGQKDHWVLTNPMKKATGQVAFF
jgi:hypothetical protein